MKTNFIKCLAGLVISLFFIAPSHAALVEIDDPVFGEAPSLRTLLPHLSGWI